MFKFDTVELFCTFFVVFLFSWYFYYSYCFNYWRKKGVPTHHPRFPAGNITKSLFGKENLFVTIQNIHNAFKSRGDKHGGLYFFNGPVYLPIDPLIIKSILITDFEHFVDRGVFFDEEKYPLSGHLFSITGSKWKTLRAKLSPTFTSGKLKAMYDIFLKTTVEFVKTLEPIAERGDDINIKFAASHFTTDIISSTALGLETNTLKNPENEVSKMVFQVFNPPIWSLLKTVLSEGFRNPGNILKVMLIDRNVETFFTTLVKDTIEFRYKSKLVRKDFLSLILDIKDTQGLSFNEVAAQCFVFFLAGFETSSQTISCCIHSLAHNLDIQEKLRKEIFDNLGKDYQNYTYEDVLKLPYLDKVFNETLRLYPVLGVLNRICVKPYKVPGTDVIIEKDTPVLISTLGLQHDPEYFPDPLKFDPERFNEDRSIGPFTFLPFGDGPRNCIGARYGKLQTKLGIAALVSQYKFSPSSSTPKNIEYDRFPKSLVMTPAKGITVKINKL